MSRIKVHDKEFEIYIPQDQIERAIKKVAENINRDYAGKNPLFLIVLNGAFMFAAELFKSVEVECEISFVKLSSYSGTASTSVIRELIGLDHSIAGRNVVLVEDIIDTGLTMLYTIDKLRKLDAKDVKIATMLFKPKAFQQDYAIEYIGLEIPNDFIVGYGLDYNEHARNLPDIYKIVKT
ncbi:MAG: hypoxanthine phosphoribosyltransferase [Bacteroidetes bacterium HGW-Bacteroidetes-1]|jgi:hypoxanthine phosphoribosyltransferase|nr:MAG: hypoxanthine phosphoribosyltransferase [Bacteroidetes bacterium HGW-Bacteroidetes-1]